jgi:hypothetical protein
MNDLWEMFGLQIFGDYFVPRKFVIPGFMEFHTTHVCSIQQKPEGTPMQVYEVFLSQLPPETQNRE